MEVSLKIDEATCIKCGKCVKVCPAGIFSQQKLGVGVEMNNLSYCIVCGHCAAACPTASVVHGNFPPEKVHKIDRSALPSPEAVMLLLKSRRSNRAFAKERVSKESLNMILEAAHRAPTASNKQQVAFAVVTEPEKLAAVIKYTMDSFISLKKMLSNPLVKPLVKMFMPGIYAMFGRMETMEQEYMAGKDPILRGATALILIHTPKDSRFGRDDANLASQNGSIMAESLGVSQFYTGFVCTAIRRDRKRRMEKMLGVDGIIQAGLALGMPAFLFTNCIDKKDIEVMRF